MWPENLQGNDFVSLEALRVGIAEFEAENIENARRHLKQAAMNGSIEAQRYLGELEFIYGDLPEVGFNWLSLAARRGDEMAFDVLYQAFSPVSEGFVNRIFFFVDPKNQTVQEDINITPFGAARRINRELVDIDEDSWKASLLLHDVYELDFKKDFEFGQPAKDDSDYEVETTTLEKLWDSGEITISDIKLLANPLITPFEFFKNEDEKYNADDSPITVEDLGITLPQNKSLDDLNSASDNPLADAYLLVGDLYHHAGFSNEAADAWAEAGKLGASNVENRREYLGSILAEMLADDSIAEQGDFDGDDYGAYQERLMARMDAGDMDAANELGTEMAQDGLYEEAILFHRRAAEAGHVEAQNNLGADYYHLGDLDKAQEWYQKSAEAGFAIAQNNLGTVFLRKSRPDLAKPWFELAAAQDNIDAMLNLSNILAAEGSVDKAIDLILPLAEIGIRNAQNAVAILFANLGDMERAKSYWMLAADESDPMAIMNLGVYFMNTGEHDLALRWFTLAYLNGHTEAKEFIDKIQPASGEWFPWEDAVEDYESAIWEYAHGDAVKARELLEKSAHGGWWEAEYDLGLKLLGEWTTAEHPEPLMLDAAVSLIEKGATWHAPGPDQDKVLRQLNDVAKAALRDRLAPGLYERLGF